MFRLFVATFLFASANSCFPPPPQPTTPPSANVSLDLCQGALKPVVTVSPTSLAKCIVEQPTIVATLLAALTSGGDPAAYLLANGQAAAAKLLRVCIARELLLVNADGTFSMEKLKKFLLGSASGSAFAANTQLGLDLCPAVVDYNIEDYLKCVLTYCYTGAAPTTGK